ncbi:MAG: hypothetical protein U0K79_09025 [Phascolarctobacterium sp.]|nr:hypothetical protein [Phascolarctobacterium sp.]
MRKLSPMCSKTDALNSYYKARIERYKKREAIQTGICTIIKANKCSYSEAESILESVKSILKNECILCFREGEKE